MMLTRTLATAIVAAFGAHGALGAAPAARSAHGAPPDATVTSLRLVPTAGRADVVIHVDGTVTYKHFTLSNPDKIVVDLTGATLGLPEGDSYDGVARGGITRIRYSQFTKTVVRVVLTLDKVHAYDVTQTGSEVRISVATDRPSFAPWQVGGAGADSADAPLARVQPDDAAAPAVAASAIAPTANPRPSSALAAPPRKQQSQEPRITWTFENAPINDVLSTFSAFTGRTILPSRNVSGTVTANIVNQPWDVALKEIMNANGYDVTVNPDGIIVVDTFQALAARQATIPLVTRNVRLNYARAAAVMPMVKARLSRVCAGTPGVPQQPVVTQPAPGQPTTTPPGEGAPEIESFACPQRGAVTADTITNSVSITDIPSALPDLERYARSLDLRQPQVNIRAKIILVDRTTLEGLGLRYDLGSQQQFFNDVVPRLDSLGQPLTNAGQILLGGNTISAIADATARIPSAALQLVFSSAMGNFDFTTFLEALQTNTLVDVQAEPSTSVLNNRTANLTSGTQVPIRVVDAGSAAGNTSNAPRATVQMQQTGIILTVTPQITNNRQVQMKVHVEDSDVQFQSNDVGAVFPKQSFDREVLVADGETAVMGGLTQTTVNSTRSGIPVLIDLPIIGRLFGVSNRTETKRDLLILLTPHIIDEGQTPPTDRP
jgi:type IV pilus assembly protein PilQ